MKRILTQLAVFVMLLFFAAISPLSLVMLIGSCSFKVWHVFFRKNSDYKEIDESLSCIETILGIKKGKTDA